MAKFPCEMVNRLLFRACAAIFSRAARTFFGAVPPKLTRLLTERSTESTANTASVIRGSIACIAASGSAMQRRAALRRLGDDAAGDRDGRRGTACRDCAPASRQDRSRWNSPRRPPSSCARRRASCRAPCRSSRRARATARRARPSCLPCPPACPSGRRAAGPSSRSSKPMSAPMMRPVLARTSSAASGLRFCGMIEEPVVNLSDSRTKPTSGDVQITISSAKRDRCTAAIAAAPSVSSTKSRSDTASSEFAVGRSKPSALRRHLAVDRKRRAGERRRAERAFVQPLARIGEAAAVARRHLDIGEQVMAEGDRLRGLQMGEARHHGRGVFERLLGERALIGGERRVDPVDGVAHPEPEIGRHLVVARARGVQPAGRRRRSARASRLSTFMWMSSSARENLKCAVLDL